MIPQVVASERGDSPNRAPYGESGVVDRHKDLKKRVEAGWKARAAEGKSPVREVF